MIRRDKIPTHVAPVDRVLTVASTDAAAHGGRVLVPRATDAIRRLYTEYAWLGVLNAAAVTFAPVYALRWGAEPALVGLLVAAPAVTGLLVSLPAARLLAAYANPWTLMLRARVAARLPYALVVLLPMLPFGRQAEWFVFLIVLTHIPGHLSQIGLTSLMPELIPEAGRASILSGWLLRLGVVGALTTLVAGCAIEQLTFPIGYQILFGVGLVTSLLGVRALAGAQPASGRWSRMRLGGGALPHPRAWPRPFRDYLMLVCLFQLGFGMGTPLLALFWVRDLELSDGVVGLLASTTAAAQVTSYPAWGWLAARRSPNTPRDAVLLAAMVALGVHPVLTVVSGGALPLLLAASLVGGVGSGGLQLGLFEGLLQHTPAEGRPGYIATSNTLTYLALMLGPVLGTLLTGLAGTGPLLCVAAGIRLAAPGIQAFSQRRAAA